MKNNENIEKKDKIICDEEGAGTRVDLFLFQKYPEYSRSYFQKLASGGMVTVNGKKVSKSFSLKSGDQVEVSFPKPPELSIEPQDVPFDVIDTQKDFLIVNKPAGLVVHHTQEAKNALAEPTLVSGLMYRFKEFAEFDDSERPGIVHRLDKNTSGLLVVARNVKAQIELSRMFKERLVSKTYLAIVKGHPDLEGSIELPVGRHPVERHKMSHVSYAGKPALTHYNVLKYYKKGLVNPECALVSVRIVTGRTHQIRVHFAAIGHALMGDTVYGIRSKMIKRQSLHAWKLSFEYHGEKFDYECPLPEDLDLLLSKLNDYLIEI